MKCQCACNLTGDFESSEKFFCIGSGNIESQVITIALLATGGNSPLGRKLAAQYSSCQVLQINGAFVLLSSGIQFTERQLSEVSSFDVQGEFYIQARTLWALYIL